MGTYKPGIVKTLKLSRGILTLPLIAIRLILSFNNLGTDLGYMALTPNFFATSATTYRQDNMKLL